MALRLEPRGAGNGPARPQPEPPAQVSGPSGAAGHSALAPARLGPRRLALTGVGNVAGRPAASYRRACPPGPDRGPAPSPALAAPPGPPPHEAWPPGRSGRGGPDGPGDPRPPGAAVSPASHLRAVANTWFKRESDALRFASTYRL